MPNKITDAEDLCLAFGRVETQSYSGGYDVSGQLRWVEDRFTPQTIDDLTDAVGSKMTDQHRFNSTMPNSWPYRNGVKLGGVVLLAADLDASDASAALATVPAGSLGSDDDVFRRFVMSAGNPLKIKLQDWQLEAFTHTPQEVKQATVASAALLLAVLDVPYDQRPLSLADTPTADAFDSFLRSL